MQRMRCDTQKLVILFSNGTFVDLHVLFPVFYGGGDSFKYNTCIAIGNKDARRTNGKNNVGYGNG